MINLLPPEEKERLILEKKKKLVIVLGNVIIISLICLILILFSLKFYILGEITSQKIALDNIEKKYQTPDFLLFKQIVQKYNSILVKIDNFYKKETYFNDALETILEIQKPDGLYLSDISVARIKENNKIKVTASGISDNRDNLSILKSNIENNEKIENFYFPPNNWIKPKDIEFYLTFEIMSR